MSFRTTGYNYNAADIGSFFCDLSNNQTINGTKTFSTLPMDASSNTFATRAWVTANTPSTSTTVTITSLATTLADYATSAALASYATTASLASYVLTSSLPSLTSYAKKTDLPVRAPHFVATIAPGGTYNVTAYGVYLFVVKNPWVDRNSTRVGIVAFTGSQNGGPMVFDFCNGNSGTTLSFDATNMHINTEGGAYGNCDIYFLATLDNTIMS